MYGDEKFEKELIGPIYQTPIMPDNSVSNLFCVILPVDPEEYTVRHSKIISREYKLKVTLQLPVPHRNVSVDVPVFIGDRRLTKENNSENVHDELVEPPTYWHAMSEEK
uniref:Arrestin C-terminal-like domain-containing protein n=1 Tax=Heliothis virescens TaxID=7102 RepID=A0A2A4JPH7_HELVI